MLILLCIVGLVVWSWFIYRAGYVCGWVAGREDGIQETRAAIWDEGEIAAKKEKEKAL